MPETLYLIDCHSLIFQDFHAIPPMTAPDGRPTNAVFGFARDLLNIIDKKRPDYLICAFDAAGPTFRDQLYDQYKAQRGPMPDDLRPQIDMIRQLIQALGVPVLEQPGFEADDIIATVVGRAAERGLDVIICSGDKDVRQLLSPNVSIYDLRKDRFFDTATLRATWGIGPEQVADLLAMTGDSSDNIPGIEGIGPKTAATLLNRFGDLEGVLANVDRVSGQKRRQRLRAGAAAARLARQLVRLRDDVPLQFDWQAARRRPVDTRRLAQLFHQFGFRRLAQEFSVQRIGQTVTAATQHIVRRPVELEQLAGRLAEQPVIAMAVATAGEPGQLGPSPVRARLAGLAFCWLAGEAWYVPLAAEPERDGLELPVVHRFLGPLLARSQPAKVGHDLKPMLIVLARAGLSLDGLLLDTMVADYLLQAGARAHGLEQLARRYLDQELPVAAAAGGQTAGGVLGPLARQRAGAAACCNAEVAFRLAPLLQDRLEQQGLWHLYRSVEVPLIPVLADMERIGVTVDVAVLEEQSRELGQRLQEIERQVYQIAGHSFNIASPLQLRRVLFDELKLPVIKSTRTGPSTDQEVLEQLAGQHILPALLIEHRQLAKLKGTYIDALPKLVNPATGRIHASFNQVVTATGRLSSSDPNLQNIPIRTEQGRQIRRAFVAGPGRVAGQRAEPGSGRGRPGQDGWVLLSADYSQIELRILAHLSADPALCRAFAEDQDIHAYVAAQIHGVTAAQVTAQMRRTAKMVNFGVIYGLSAYGLAARLGIEQDQAQKFIDDYFDKYRGVEQFIAQVLDQAHRQQYVQTLLGRRRSIRGVRANPGRNLNQAEREAINTVVQGSAADMIKVAMINLHKRMKRQGTQGRLLLQIHDELVLEVPGDEQRAMADVVREEMTGAVALSVPLKVDLAAGPNWLDLEPVGKQAAAEGTGP